MVTTDHGFRVFMPAHNLHLPKGESFIQSSYNRRSSQVVRRNFPNTGKFTPSFNYIPNHRRRHDIFAALEWKVLQLATFQDKFTRRIVGWQVSERMTVQLVLEAFNRARSRGLIKRAAIIHTDRGSQYASVECCRLLYVHGFRQSMSAKGNCFIEGYYNRIRRHSSLGYVSPMEFEKQLKIKNQRSKKSFLSCFS